MNIQDIYQNLDSFSIDDLRDLNDAVFHTIKAKRQQQSAIKKLSLRVGDKVSWDGRKGYKEGTIIKINRTRCDVSEKGAFSSWAVPISMLNKMEPVFDPNTGEWN